MNLLRFNHFEKRKERTDDSGRWSPTNLGLLMMGIFPSFFVPARPARRTSLEPAKEASSSSFILKSQKSC